MFRLISYFYLRKKWVKENKKPLFTSGEQGLCLDGVLCGSPAETM